MIYLTQFGVGLQVKHFFFVCRKKEFFNQFVDSAIILCDQTAKLLIFCLPVKYNKTLLRVQTNFTAPSKTNNIQFSKYFNKHIMRIFSYLSDINLRF